MTIEIDFTKIRPHHGDRKFGFEELCAQISQIQYQNTPGSFVRKGQGADGGVEFFFKSPSDEETAWQAKYVFDWDSLRSQTKGSLEKALEKHPSLSKYIICIPFNLSDGRQDRKKSARQKYNEWISKQKKAIEDKGRSVEIELWDETRLIGYLTSNTNLMAGVLSYWFDVIQFTPEWFAQKFASTRLSLGSRYVPESNINLPIRKDLAAASRNRKFYTDLESFSDNLAEKTGNCLKSCSCLIKVGATRDIAEDEFRSSFDSLMVHLDEVQDYGFEYIALNEWTDLVHKCKEALGSLSNLTYSENPKNNDDEARLNHRMAERSINDLRSILYDFLRNFVQGTFKLAHANTIILDGDAGSGKSHLLADIISEHLEQQLPGIMILGSQFTNINRPWRCVVNELDLPQHINVSRFLSSLNAAGKSKNCRALIFIDAINEREGLEIWPDRLQSFICEVEKYTHVCLVLSCRTTFLPHIIPDNFDESSVERITHVGFSQTSGVAAKAYLDGRGINRVATPNLSQEFDSPLFLKTLCDYLDKTSQKQLPKGLDSITALFEYYNNAVATQVDRTLGLDSRLQITSEAIKEFAKLLSTEKSEYISYQLANDFFNKKRDGKGTYSESLLVQLISEGILSEEFIRTADGNVQPVVRFTFQRFNDYAIANLLISEAISGKTNTVTRKSLPRRSIQILTNFFSKTDPEKELRAGGKVYEFIFAKDSYRNAGVIEALCVLVPEHYDRELITFCPQDDIPYSIRNGFKESLLLRNQSKFTEETLECLQLHYSEDEVEDSLVQVSTEPNNKFNALHRHQLLKLHSMIERDISWSFYLLWSAQETASPVMDLIDWCLENGNYDIDDDRCKLAAIQLTWFLTTNNRKVRDRATKALSCILSSRSSLALELYQLFEEVDAPYLQERLLCAIYGACIQGSDQNSLPEIAESVYTRVFASESSVGNALLRDHARGILFYASFKNALPCSVNLSRSDPSCGNLPDIEHVSDFLISSYTKDYGNGNVFGDSIVSSVIDDGDFARYVVDNKVDNWSATHKHESSLKSPEVFFHDWETNFYSTSNKEQKDAYDRLKTHCKSLKGSVPFATNPEGEKLKTLNSKFQALLSEKAWEEYRTSAKGYLEHNLFSSHKYGSDIKSFDNLWARRWICKRAHDFGWTVDRFDAFEKGTSYDRNDHEKERFGKKYQWLALYDLIARLGEQYQFIEQKYSMDEPAPLTGAGQIGLRNIDPSLLVTQTRYDGWRDGANVWWAPADIKLKKATPIERVNWLNSENDILNYEQLFNVTNPQNQTNWLVLNSFFSFRKDGVFEGHRRNERESWCRIRCYIVKKSDADKFVEKCSGTILVDPHSLPTKTLSWGHNYIGEYPWHPEAQGDEMWVEHSFSNHEIAKVAIPTTDYFCEKGGYDYSMDESVRLNLPDKWVYDGLHLQLQNGKDLQYLDLDGEVTFFDPSVKTEGPSAALVDKDKFLNLLNELDCEAIWVIAGEKNVYGGQRAGHGFGGCLSHTATYRLGDDGFERTYFEEMGLPTKGQLENCFEGTPVPDHLQYRIEKPRLPVDRTNELAAALYAKFLKGEEE